MGYGSTETIKADESENGHPKQIGNFKIIRQIGSGGVGIVYLAVQEKPVRRNVAIKVLQLGKDSKETRDRFDKEQQAMARMDHPNVAKIFDSGKTNLGQPFFVMEYVKGIPITIYCDKKKLTINERLELFIDVCHGIDHAHKKGLIHRDLKPSNVLVCQQNDKPIPKIIDFGIARDIDFDLTKTGMLIGTPYYMSPEQIELSELGIDTRTDIYSMGVILYELLVGMLPLYVKELSRKNYEELLTKICKEEPCKPSDKLKYLRKSAERVVQSRRTDIETLKRKIKGDLDVIVLKALEKMPEDRYSTASYFAEDIRRHLNNIPIQASPPKILYRLIKFWKRHKKRIMESFGIIILSIIILILPNFSKNISPKKTAEPANFKIEEKEALSEFLILITENIKGKTDVDVVYLDFFVKIMDLCKNLGGNSEKKNKIDKSVITIEDSFEFLEALAIRTIGYQHLLLVKQLLRYTKIPFLEASVRHIVGKQYLILGEYEKAVVQLTEALEIRKKHLKEVRSNDYIKNYTNKELEEDYDERALKIRETLIEALLLQRKTKDVGIKNRN